MYGYCGGSPINRTDPDGSFGMLVSAGIAAGIEVDTQMLEAYLTDGNYSLDWGSIGIAVATGLVGAGVLKNAGKFAKLAELAINAGGNIAEQAHEGQSFNVAYLVADVALGQAGGKIAGKFMKGTDTYGKLAKTAQRAERVARNNPKLSRVEDAVRANQRMTNYVETGVSAGIAAGGGGSSMVKVMTQEPK
jgi:hypothetical protein